MAGRWRCCRWSRTSIHRWERAVESCDDFGWLLYWQEKPTPDDVFCSNCGHTMTCHGRRWAMAQIRAALGALAPARAAPPRWKDTELDTEANTRRYMLRLLDGDRAPA